jgi:hypothetical protein
MSFWILCLGVAFVVIGLVLLSPLGNLLPIDFWLGLENLFSSGSHASEHLYYRMAPGEPSRTLEFLLIGIGALLVLGSLYLEHRK